uniref:Uncharacterized protein n=1 Tax=Zooxanthella nutricula TaxID=1333877 RepID=A0A6U6NZ99_9DINO|mmetsp:Transcript_54008/g.164085  ORF Transcript_54008/g.164085 Transcript_54008/m.164085 type:complete len:579 (+) Transcript_54008:80-1816(+)
MTLAQGLACCGLGVSLSALFVLVLLVEPFHFLANARVPNAAALLHVVPANATDLSSTETQPTIAMPQHLWPNNMSELSREEINSRQTFWTTWICLTFGLTMVLGTSILAVPLPSERRDESMWQHHQRSLGVGATITHLILVTKIVVSAARSGRVSISWGLDWEGYAEVVGYLSAWLLAQSCAVRFLSPNAKFSSGAFATAMLKTTVPFVADPFDTLKDAVFAGIALAMPSTVAKAIGVISLTYLWGLHLGMIYFDESLRWELVQSYASVLFVPRLEAAPGAEQGCDEGTASGATEDWGDCTPFFEESGPSPGPGSQAWAWMLQQLLPHCAPSRQRWLMIEDGPQGLMALGLALAVGNVGPLITVVNVVLPLVRLIFAQLAYHPVVRQESVAAWLVRELLIAVKCGLQVRSHFCLVHLGAAGEAGATALARALETNRTLSRLDLRGSHSGDAGAITLARALEENRTLTELDLTGNDIGDAGALAIARALEANSTLTRLSLWGGNHIGDAGAAAIARALEANGTLTRLSLCGNRIGDVGAAALARALEANRTLKGLDLGENDIGDASTSPLSKHRPRVWW